MNGTVVLGDTETWVLVVTRMCLRVAAGVTAFSWAYAPVLLRDNAVAVTQAKPGYPENTVQGVGFSMNRSEWFRCTKLAESDLRDHQGKAESIAGEQPHSTSAKRTST